MLLNILWTLVAIMYQAYKFNPHPPPLIGSYVFVQPGGGFIVVYYWFRFSPQPTQRVVKIEFMWCKLCTFSVKRSILPLKMMIVRIVDVIKPSHPPNLFVVCRSKQENLWKKLKSRSVKITLTVISGMFCTD